MGDWNHAKIHDNYSGLNQIHFNYQMIKKDLENRGLTMGIDISSGHKEHSYLGYLAIDHIAIGNAFTFKSNPEYSEYIVKTPIGIPDHAYLFAEVEL